MISDRYKNDKKSILKLNQVQINAKNRIEKKIEDGIYTFENIHCPVCESSDSELLSEKDRYGLDNHVVVCKNCGLVYTNPRMSIEAYADFYDNEYRKLYIGTETPHTSYFNRQYRRAKEIFSFISAHYPKLGSSKLTVLEVGCGAGGILKFFKEKGCDILGVDLDRKYLEYGSEKHDLRLILGSLHSVPENLKPDIIIYSHVLEHIPDLNSELTQLRSLCKKDTLIYIEVPGIKNINNAYKMDPLLYFQNAHTFHFTLRTLKNIFQKNGFELVIGNEFINSLFKIRKNNIEVKSENDYGKVITFLKKMEKSRYFYPLKLSTIKKKILSIIHPDELLVFRSPKK